MQLRWNILVLAHFTILISVPQIISISKFSLITVANLLRFYCCILRILNHSNAHSFTMACWQALEIVASNKFDIRRDIFLLCICIYIIVFKQIATLIICICQQRTRHLKIIQRGLLSCPVEGKLLFLLAYR